MLTHHEQLLLLNHVPGIGSTKVRQLVEIFGSLEHLCRASMEALQRLGGLSPALATRVADGCRDDRWLEHELARVKKAGATILTIKDAAYPKWLKEIHDPPLALYVRGRLEPVDDLALGIVGTRRASAYGLNSAKRLAHDLAFHGITIVSGLARGIDAAAHEGALQAGGRTLAILGSGLDTLYPPEHEPLAARIAQSGAVISEFPMMAEPDRFNFPRRNRIISGLARGVVVVEAAQRSGALITADFALEQGREVFAVPGPITTSTSRGTHELLKEGARLVTCAQDILEELHLDEQPLARGASVGDCDQAARGALPKLEQQVFACVSERQPRYIDTIAQQSGLGLPVVSSALLQLELKRLIQQLPGKQFVRKSGS